MSTSDRGRWLSWARRSPSAQVCLLGAVFFLWTSAAVTQQRFSVKLLGAQLGSAVEIAVYGTAAPFSFLAPTVVNVLGPRRALTLGLFCISTNTLAPFLLVLLQASWCRYLVVATGVIAGAGGTFVWTAQGRLLLELSDGTNQA